MTPQVREGTREPITFANAPTVERDGRSYLTEDAAEVLVAQLADEYATLLSKLAEE